MKRDDTFLRMFSNCIPVLGESQSAIYDLQRKQALNIPNDLYKFIQLFEKHPITELFEVCGKDNKKVVEEYIQFLIHKEVVFYINEEEKELFPKLSLHWTSSSIVSNAIIEISEITFVSFNKIIKDLTALGCEYLYIKITTVDAFLKIKELTEKLEGLSIFSVIFEATLNEYEKIEDYEQLAEKNKRIETIFLFGEPNIQSKSRKIIVTSPNKFRSNKASFFSINITLFTESQKYNTYFNRKIFINKKGEILNAPETKENYGNINDITLESLKTIISSGEFQKYWRISKDVIEECKDCELRYMCVDNRLPEKTKEGSYIFRTKCEVKI